jgi:hypothetical protein
VILTTFRNTGLALLAGDSRCASKLSNILPAKPDKKLDLYFLKFEFLFIFIRFSRKSQVAKTVPIFLKLKQISFGRSNWSNWSKGKSIRIFYELSRGKQWLIVCSVWWGMR